MQWSDAVVFCSFKVGLSYYKQDSLKSQAHLGSAKATALIAQEEEINCTHIDKLYLTSSTIFLKPCLQIQNLRAIAVLLETFIKSKRVNWHIHLSSANLGILR